MRSVLQAGKWALALALVLSLAGCAVNIYKGRPRDKARISELSTEVDRISDLRKKEKDELQRAMEDLQKKLNKEITDKEIKLEMAERGLVITFVDKVLFDSGKAQIKEGAFSALDKVSGVIRKRVSDRDIGIEGHTDNVPIKHSGWKSNWELSTARATSVLHYLVDEGKVNPARCSAIGYGEFRAVASNDTPEGRQENRRVEIVIMPTVRKVEMGEEAAKKSKEEIK